MGIVIRLDKLMAHSKMTVNELAAKLGMTNVSISNLKTGKMKYIAHSGDTVKGILYDKHPNTNEKIVGYQLPFVKEAVDMCLKAALVVPQIRYIGWDVAITENGPAIIEGNTYCAHDFWQLPPHTPEKIGVLPTIKKYVPEFEY
jgi:transcriptional regulator with XRE-family HTH domain